MLLGRLVYSDLDDAVGGVKIRPRRPFPLLQKGAAQSLREAQVFRWTNIDNFAALPLTQGAADQVLKTMLERLLRIDAVANVPSIWTTNQPSIRTRYVAFSSSQWTRGNFCHPDFITRPRVCLSSSALGHYSRFVATLDRAWDDTVYACNAAPSGFGVLQRVLPTGWSGSLGRVSERCRPRIAAFASLGLQIVRHCLPE